MIVLVAASTGLGDGEMMLIRDEKAIANPNQSSREYGFKFIRFVLALVLWRSTEGR